MRFQKPLIKAAVSIFIIQQYRISAACAENAV